MQILVFTEVLSPRIRYIFNHILSSMLGFDVVFTHDKDEFKSFQGPSISYTNTAIAHSIHITPHPLLTLKGVDSQVFGFFSWHQLPAFFPTDDSADIPFDLFAASFFLITRYEEYYNQSPDLHGRFRAEESVSFKNDFLQIPVVDHWVNELGLIIKRKFPFVDLKKREFKFLPTIDIDNAYAYRYKGTLRAIAGTGISLLKLRILDFLRRIIVYLRFKPDPYNTYKKLFRILSPYPQAVWFILGGKYGEYDRGNPLNNKYIVKLLHRISNHFIIGIHPSYASGTSFESVKDEYVKLTSILGKEVKCNRQHFLRIKFPNTYRNLVELGITYDFSLGYSNHIGFRAGTCTPFPFFDLIDDSELPIKLVPFQVMDRALLDGLKLSPTNAVKKSIEVAKIVKEVGGTFVLVWHNESLSGINEWKGWENVFREIVEGVKLIN